MKSNIRVARQKAVKVAASKKMRVFRQKPSPNQFSSAPGSKPVEELFQQFTADIIRRDVIFTR